MVAPCFLFLCWNQYTLISFPTTAIPYYNPRHFSASPCGRGTAREPGGWTGGLPVWRFSRDLSGVPNPVHAKRYPSSPRTLDSPLSSSPKHRFTAANTIKWNEVLRLRFANGQEYACHRVLKATVKRLLKPNMVIVIRYLEPKGLNNGCQFLFNYVH